MAMDIKLKNFQFDVQWLDSQKNITLIQNLLESINEDVDLIVLPEMFLSGFCMDPSRSAIGEESVEIRELISASKESGIAIIGSLAIREGDQYYNRVLLISSDGIIGRYDKQYLYSPSGENKVFDSKYETNLIQFKGWNILPQVCYDLRFPENVRPFPTPDLLIYMANWPAPRIYHWDTLLRARAIENQCYVVGCNRLGIDGNDWKYPGHSVVIKPDGTALESNITSNSEVYELSMNRVNSYRAKYRFLEDKKV